MRLLCVACVLCGTSVVASAEVSEDVRRVSDDVRRLPERRAVHLPETSASHTWIEIRQDSILAAVAAPDFADVRIVTEAGRSSRFS